MKVILLLLPVSLVALVAALGCRSEASPTTSELAAIQVPPGFSISVFARVPNARQMALSPAGTLFVGSRKEGKVFAIRDASKAATDNVSAGPYKVIAADLNDPNGVAYANGSLYVAEVSRIRFDDIEARLDKPPAPVVVRDDFPDDELHGWKYIAIGPDGWLYVPVGAPCNLCLNEDKQNYASITRMTLDGKTREVYARGIRNTVGFDWHPETKALWFTENGSDMLGEDFPGDELNTAPKAGLHFGYPHCHNGPHADAKLGDEASCASDRYVPPAKVLGPHVAALGMKFYRGDMFPPEYRGRVLIAEHGSWNRSKPIGYRVMMVRFEGGAPISYEPFAEGWLTPEGVAGRPVDVLELPDGSLLVSDDSAGVIYRITYHAPPKTP